MRGGLAESDTARVKPATTPGNRSRRSFSQFRSLKKRALTQQTVDLNMRLKLVFKEWSMAKPESAGSLETRQRLLEAAGEIFAEQGFHNATVRDVCQRAGANIAAVNYHFGDKEGLYTAVLRYAHQCATEKYSPEMAFASEGNVPAEQRLCMFVRSFLRHIFDEGQPAWHGKLMSREMMEPTPALEVLVKEEIRPRAEMLEAIIRELLGRRASPERVRLCVRSIIGQCI